MSPPLSLVLASLLVFTGRPGLPGKDIHYWVDLSRGVVENRHRGNVGASFVNLSKSLDDEYSKESSEVTANVFSATVQQPVQT